MRKRILVTGGAGFIGIHLVRRMVREKLGDIAVLDNESRGRRDALKYHTSHIDFIPGDIRDRDCLVRAMRGVEWVFHLAAQSSVIGSTRDIDYSFSTNVVGTFEVLHAALAAGIERVVFTSSREVYGEPERLPVPEDAPLQPKNAYGVSKACGEFYCRAFAERGLDVVILRLANVYGPGDRDRVIPLFLEHSRRNEPLIVYGGTQILDFVWVEDVVDALLASAGRSGWSGPVNVGSGFGTSIRELAHEIICRTGSQSSIETRPARSLETCAFIADTSKSKQLLGLASPSAPLFHLDKVIGAGQTIAGTGA